MQYFIIFIKLKICIWLYYINLLIYIYIFLKYETNNILLPCNKLNFKNFHDINKIFTINLFLMIKENYF